MHVFAYVLLFLSSVLSGCLLFSFDGKSKILKYISVFGGAFLMAVCFVHLLPEAFEAAETACHTEVLPCEHSLAHNHAHEHHNHFPMGGFVLLGFILQLLLELLSKGAEHGHVHNADETSVHGNYISALMILCGVSIHAFLEGFALISDGVVNYSLLAGVIIHNIPISMVIVSSFLKAGCSKVVSICYLSVFALMGVLGSVSGTSLSFVQQHGGEIMCFVVGILLHVSVSTLFDSGESHKYNFVRFAIVLSAFALACVLPH